VCVSVRDEYSSPPRLHNSLVTCLEFSLVAKVCPPWLAVRAIVGRSRQLTRATVTYLTLGALFCLFPWLDSPQWAMVSSLSRLHDHTQTHDTPVEEWSAQRRELYLTIHNTHNGNFVQLDDTVLFDTFTHTLHVSGIYHPSSGATTANWSGWYNNLWVGVVCGRLSQ
jgi:hypothetical protein